MQVTHPFVTGKADGTDVTLVKPSDWNAQHLVTTSADGVVLGVPAGAGAGPVQEIPMGSLYFSGMVVAFAGSTAPTGWVMCDGRSVVRTDPLYAALFAVIGTTYGAADGSHFSLPDLRGRVVAAVDAGAGQLPGWVLGSAGGESSHVLSINEMAYHNHTASDGGHQHANENNWSFAVRDAGYGPVGAVGGGPGFSVGWSNVTNWGYASISVGYTGAGWGHNNVQPTIALNYIIKL